MKATTAPQLERTPPLQVVAVGDPAAPVIQPSERLVAEHMSAYYGSFQAIRDVSLAMEPNKVTALIGPSGCGKSTFIRCLNRLHEVVKGARVSGRVLLDGQDLYDRRTDPVTVRRHVGMLFQRPNPFPTMSIFDNVAAGLRLNGTRNRGFLTDKVEHCLRQAALWDEVKDKLKQPAVALSGGQQQRLCLARVLAVDPAVILMDEPCSALDPISTVKIEDLITELKRVITIAIVTHNMQQAGRVSDFTALLLANEAGAGQLIEFGPTRLIFTHPTDPRTDAYISGRFG